jgi:uncharacterized coiled-coil DUF342 family protein
MEETLKAQINELHKKREEKLAAVRKLGEKIRKAATEIVRLKKDLGLRKEDAPREIKKRIKALEFKISAGLPLSVEREIAKDIKKLESRLKEVEKLEKSKGSIVQLEHEIKAWKAERDKLKKELDLDKAELDDLKKELRTASQRRAGQFDEFSLAEVVTLKKSKK